MYNIYVYSQLNLQKQDSQKNKSKVQNILKNTLMNIKNSLLLLLATSTIMSCQSSGSAGDIETKADSVSYILGANGGQRMVADFARGGIDTLMNMDLFFEGLTDAGTSEELKYDLEADASKIQVFFQEYQMHQQKQTTDSTVGPFSADPSRIDSISYLMGAQQGQGMRKGFDEAGMDSVLNFDLYLEALLFTGKGGESTISVEENRPMLDTFFKKLEEERLEAEFGDVKAASEEYLATNRGLSTVTETESGLQYEILVEGNGPKPTRADKVKVHYHGTLVDGTIFDSSVERGEPAVFGVGQVIKGWTEALQLMPVGSKWKLTIPYDIAYGTRPRPGGKIRAFDALVFEVELLEIVK